MSRCDVPLCRQKGTADYLTADGREKLRVCARHKRQLEAERPGWVQIFRDLTRIMGEAG